MVCQGEENALRLAPFIARTRQKLHAYMCNVCSSQLKLKQKENDTLVAPYSRSYNRTMISTVVESDDGGVHAVGLLA